jgi:hypothetical protein
MENIIDILWAAVRAIDASDDFRKESPAVQTVKRDLLRTISQLEAAKAERTGKGPVRAEAAATGEEPGKTGAA